jgi:hypothetical protein
MRSALEPDVTLVRMNKVVAEVTVWLSPLWWWLSCLTAVLAAGAGVAGLAVSGRVHGRETVVLSDAATAQDIVTLVWVAVPGLSVFALVGALTADMAVIKRRFAGKAMRRRVVHGRHHWGRLGS